MTQLDLWDKPFHSITVFQRAHPVHGGKALVVRFDNLAAMEADIQRQLDLDLKHREKLVYVPVAYIFACRREYDDKGRTIRVTALETYYPIQLP